MTEFTIKGFMLDPARLTEPLDLYKRYIEFCAEYGYNTLLWHFTDNHGCALRFPSRPELASPHAFTPEETRKLVDFAGSFNIDVIPEVECFGHTDYILNLKQYSHLRDNVPGSATQGICPFHDETREIMTDLFKDTAEIFSSEYIHAGLDEVSFGSHPLTRERLKDKKKWELFAEYVAWVHSVIQDQEKTMMMWGDHLLDDRKGNEVLDTEAYSSEMADLISRDIILVDWHYSAQPDPATVIYLLEKGFRVIGGTAAVCYGTTAVPRQRNIDNIKNFTRIGARTDNDNFLGLIHTVWCPWRTLPGTILFPLALGGACLENNGEEPEGFRTLFSEKTFKTQSPALSEAIEKAYTFMHHTSELGRKVPSCSSDLEGVTRDQINEDAEMSRRAETVLGLLRSAEADITENSDLFNDLVFSFKYLSAIGGLTGRFQGEFRVKEILPLLKKLYAEGIAQWDRNRFPFRPDLNDQPQAYTWDDCPLAKLKKGIEYLESLGEPGTEISGLPDTHMPD